MRRRRDGYGMRRDGGNCDGGRRDGDGRLMGRRDRLRDLRHRDGAGAGDDGVQG